MRAAAPPRVSAEKHAAGTVREHAAGTVREGPRWARAFATPNI